jgi:putative FmdB family regulatory protein
MPTYDFRCTVCGEVFEVNRSMDVTGDEKCAACGGVATKVFSPVGVAFKGTGFHNTDYRPAPKEATACPSAGGSEGCAGCCNAAE